METGFDFYLLTNKEMEEYKKAAKEYDPKACFIDEYYILGVALRHNNYFLDDFNGKYAELLGLLKTSNYTRRNEVHNEFIAKDYDNPDNVKVLGVIV